MSLSRNLLLLLVFCVLAVPGVQAAPDVRVVGLFKNRAVVIIEGKQRVLRVGQTSPEGVKLVAADSDSARLEYQGEEFKGMLDGRVSTRSKPPETEEVQIWRNSQGMYATTGSINGLPVSLLVDTGATQVAMNAAQARRLGIDYRVIGLPAAITTASRLEPAWAVTLDSVKVGDIELSNVEGVVLEGAQPQTVLLGMSYLGRLEIRNDGRLLTLQRKY
ncbi:MAG: TIGR02281 family clan AA aspartic protease [Gammaproteobacteria bacterium]